MRAKTKSLAVLPGTRGSDSKSNRGSDDSTTARVSQNALRYSRCTRCSKISVEDIGYYVFNRGAIVRRAICQKCVEAQVPIVGYPTSGHLALWLKARLGGRHYCAPCCASCGGHARAAAFGFYDYWPEQRRTLPETVFFDLCQLCTSALSAESAQADRLRIALAVNGFLVARQKSIDRERRALESTLQHPRPGRAT